MAAAFLILFASTVRGQSAGELGAWAALMVSPVGALPPRVRSNDDAYRRPSEISLRYGRWEYDNDDAAHNNFGLTVAHGLSFAQSEIALTAAYLSLQCGGCANWLIGGVEFESSVWRHAFGRSSARPITVSL